MKKTIAKIASVALALSLAIAPVSAFADTEERATTTKTFTWMVGETEPTVPETLTVGEEEWTLVSVTAAEVDSTYEPTTKTVTKSDEQTFATLEEAQAAYPESILYEDEEGFTGTLTRTQFDYEGQYSETGKLYDVTKTHGPYPTNDSINVPKSTTVSITDALGTHTETIPCIKYEWQISAYDAAGFPVGYTVACTYRGIVTVTENTGCKVKVAYEGTVTGSEQRMVKTATYQAPEPVVADDSASTVRKVLTAVGGAIAGSGALAGFIFFIRRRRNVTVRDAADTKTLAKCFAKKGEALILNLPAKINLQEGAVLLLEKGLIDESELVVKHAGVEVWKGIAQERIKLIPPTQD